VEDPKKRRRLAEQVARGELTLIKLRDKIEGRKSRPGVPDDEPTEELPAAQIERTEEDERDELWASTEMPPAIEVSDDSLVNAKQSLVDAVDGLVGVLSSAELRESIGATDRANLAKYLTIAKLRLENAIALVRSDDAGY
jgi:hypothetical protein